MASRSEQALLALVAALSAKAAETPSDICAPSRNQELSERFQETDGVGRFFNVLDGDTDPDPDRQVLGPANAGDRIYELRQLATIEWAVFAADDTEREAAHDAGMIAIDDALAADRSLGLEECWAEIERVRRSGLTTDGLPNIKASALDVAITITSDRPF
jgi:hypothetical protein